jgi:Zn-finger nucleic acid-binding protein
MLVPETMGDVTVDRCAGCGGLWFDRGEVVRVLDLHTQGVSGAKLTELERRFPSFRLSRERHRALACVRCRARMHRLPAAPRSGVYVELCGPPGIWVDAGDFERFHEFVAAGGLEVARAREDAAAGATHPTKAPNQPLTSFYLKQRWPPVSLTVLEVIHHAAGPLPQARSWGPQPGWPR